MPWIQINAVVNESLAEPLADAFMEANAASVTFVDPKDQPIFEPDLGTTPVWRDTKVIGLYDANVDAQTIIQQLQLLIPQLNTDLFKVEQLEDKDWVRAWMDQFKPMPFGDKLWIVPSWTQPPKPKAVNLFLDPGLAFGTGTHPTTAMCLTHLDQHAPTGLNVIDYGCGSGILAIAAAKLGAAQVTGCDIDPQAITASLDNAQRNQVSIAFSLVEALNTEPVDMIIANILAGPLKTLAPEFARLLKPGGKLILSGLLTTQAHELKQHYESVGIELSGLETLHEWGLLFGFKQAEFDASTNTNKSR